MALSLLSSAVPPSDLYFDSFPYPVAPIVSSAEGIVYFSYLLFAEPITDFIWKAIGFLSLIPFFCMTKRLVNSSIVVFQLSSEAIWNPLFLNLLQVC